MRTRDGRVVVGVVLAVLLATTVAGASALAFLCDDAFITFRYVSNAQAGLGLVWNPPPFLPVEGYTGFLWALLLWGTWSLFGVEPPDAANVLSMLCGVAQFVVVAVAAFRLRRRDGARLGPALALATVACIVGQRTFLQWMTSGLETALFNLAFVGWALLGFRDRSRRGSAWLAQWSTAAAVAALTRPDGLLLVAITAAVAWPALVERRVRSAALGIAPLLTVAAHIAWRRWFYGDWLPNTYYAKVIEPWPEAGIRYLECFLFEHGLWVWFPVAIGWGVVWSIRHRATWLAAVWQAVPAVAVLGGVAFHAGYYVLQVGGDHFEYRVLSQLVPLGWLSFAAMLAGLSTRAWPVAAGLAAMFVLSTAGWLHFAMTRDMPMNGVFPISHRAPAVLRPLWRWHDSRQMYLHIHFVGMRCNQLGTAWERFAPRYPRRGDFNTDPNDIAVSIDAVAGAAGWHLRDCAIIDWLGLNDWVVARTKPRTDRALEALAGMEGPLLGSDVNGDGKWDRGELGRWVLTLFPLKLEVATADPLVDMAIDLFAHEHDDALTKDEVRAFLRSFFTRGGMAHERVPPPGYIEAFEANVVVRDDRVIVVTPRATPLKPRIAAIEAEWRAKAARGELVAR